MNLNLALALALDLGLGLQERLYLLVQLVMLLGAQLHLPLHLVVQLVELPPHLPLAAFASANILLSNTALRLLLLLLHRHPRCMMTSSTSMIVETRWGIGSPLSLAVVGLVLAVGLLVALVAAAVGLVEPLDAWASSHPLRLGGKHSCMQSRSATVCID